jgi:succinoglycan biosynthesis transport protein ExoP
MPARSYLDVARRRWKVLAAAMVIGLVLGIVVGPLATPRYTATTTVRTRPITDDPFASGTAAIATVDVPTEVEVVRSADVVEAAAEAVDAAADIDLDAILADIDVQQVGDALALRITFTHDRPDRAAEWANALANAYLDQRRASAVGLIGGLVAAIDDQITAIGPNPSPGDLERIRQLQERRGALESLVTTPGDVLRPAVVPDEPSGPPEWVGQLGVLAVALLGGAAAAIVLDRVDRRVRSAAEVAAGAGPVLAVVRVADDAGLADAARLIRLRLGHPRFGRPWRLLVTTPDIGGPVNELAAALSAELGPSHSVTVEDSVLDAHGLEAAAAVDAVVVVADAATTDLDKLAAAVQALDDVKAVFAGTVLVGDR